MSERQIPRRADIRNRDAVMTAAKAIADAMDWNVRAYGKLACEEDAEFFAACVVRELEKEYWLEGRA